MLAHVFGGIGSMSDSEVEDLIKKAKAGVLCFVDGDRPYAIPVEHMYRDGHLYWSGAAKDPSTSRKLNCIKRNNRVCYVIYEDLSERPDMFKEGRRCRSLIVEGTMTVEKIKGVGEMAPLKMLRMDIEKIGNWTCPFKVCPALSRGLDWYNQLKEDFIDALVDGNLGEMIRLAKELFISWGRKDLVKVLNKIGKKPS